MTEPLTELHHIEANGIDFGYFAAGDGPLALCLHGYPDSAHTWRHLLPELAAAGYRAVAPFLRGYAPSGLAPDGQYECGAIGVDANALHEALGADSNAVIIGHDWGAMGAYAALGLDADRWRRAVTMAVPPGPVVAGAYFSYDQLRMSWYMFFQMNYLSDMVIPMNDYEFIARLWSDWSPGFDGAEDVAHFVDAMAAPENLTAALSYYRHTLTPDLQSPALAAAQAATLALPSAPLLYLHGANDGCMSPDIASQTSTILSGESRFEMVGDAGHFLHLEQPATVNELIIDFLGTP